LNLEEQAIWPQLSMVLRESSMAQQQPAMSLMAIGSYATVEFNHQIWDGLVWFLYA
jgi:hypothetical protein